MKRMGNRFNLFTSAIFFLIMTAFAVQTATAAEVQRYVFGGGVSGGPWKIGVGVGVQLLHEQLGDKYFFTVPASTGSAESSRRFVAREFDTTWIQGGNMYEIWTGTGVVAGKGAYKNMRVLEFMSQQGLNVIVRADSKIKSFSDLAGKRVNLGPAGSGWVPINKTILTALGVLDKVKIDYLDFSRGAQSLKDRRVDATFGPGAPYTNPAISEISRSIEIRMIEPTDEEVKKVIAVLPYMSAGVIPPNTAPGENSDRARTVFFGELYWIAQDSMPDQVVYDMLKVTQEPKNKEVLGKVMNFWTTAGPKFDTIARLGIPIHPGALRFWKEQGADIPAEIIMK